MNLERALFDRCQRWIRVGEVTTAEHGRILRLARAVGRRRGESTEQALAEYLRRARFVERSLGWFRMIDANPEGTA